MVRLDDDNDDERRSDPHDAALSYIFMGLIAFVVIVIMLMFAVETLRGT